MATCGWLLVSLEFVDHTIDQRDPEGVTRLKMFMFPPAAKGGRIHRVISESEEFRKLRSSDCLRLALERFPSKREAEWVAKADPAEKFGSVGQSMEYSEFNYDKVEELLIELDS